MTSNMFFRDSGMASYLGREGERKNFRVMNFFIEHVTSLPVDLSFPSLETYPCSLVRLSRVLRKMAELKEREGAVETPAQRHFRYKKK